jgi:DNA-binding CsgD family transcriptional regulator
MTSMLQGEYTVGEKRFMERLASGRSQIEIAADLGITHTALRSRIKRLKKKIIAQSDTKAPAFSD